MSIQINKQIRTVQTAEVNGFSMRKNDKGLWEGSVLFVQYDQNGMPMDSFAKLISPTEWDEFWTNFNSFGSLENVYSADVVTTGTEDASNAPILTTLNNPVI